MDITFNSSLLLVPVEIHKDVKNYIVEDKATGEFYEMPEICIDAIHLLNNGINLKEVEQQLKVKYPIEDVNLLDFMEQLFELNLIAEVDGVKLEIKKKSQKKLGFFWISPQLGKLFFNKPAFIVYLALLVINVFLFIFSPSLFPHYQDLFIFDFMFLNIPAWMVISFILVLIHEFGHVLAIRSFNLPTKLEIGHRLFLVVLETDMSSVWKLPSKDRNVLYLAGMCFDTMILFLALISQLIFANGSGLFLSIMQVVVLDTFIRIVFQFCIYMKTDLYFVFENVSGCYNLMENAQQFIRRWFPFQRTTSGSVIFAEEKRTIHLYSIFYFIGVGLTLTLYAVFYIPQLLFALKKVLPGFTEGLWSIPFWDATLFSLQIIVPLFLLLNSWRKKYILREQ